jgi:hypothetical protein
MGSESRPHWPPVDSGLVKVVPAAPEAGSERIIRDRDDSKKPEPRSGGVCRSNSMQVRHQDPDRGATPWNSR